MFLPLCLNMHDCLLFPSQHLLNKLALFFYFFRAEPHALARILPRNFDAPWPRRCTWLISLGNRLISVARSQQPSPCCNNDRVKKFQKLRKRRNIRARKNIGLSRIVRTQHFHLPQLIKVCCDFFFDALRCHNIGAFLFICETEPLHLI